MVNALRPQRGGSPSPFGAAEFTIAFLKGHGPEGSSKIDPHMGSTMSDICFEYKAALHRVQARNAVDKENEKRIHSDQLAFSETEYYIRLSYYLKTLPQKQSKMRYGSFTRYFGHLKRLGWIESTGFTEPSSIQLNYPLAPPRVFYRLSEAGWAASEAEITDPVQTLYHYSRKQRSAKKPPVHL